MVFLVYKKYITCKKNWSIKKKVCLVDESFKSILVWIVRNTIEIIF